MEKPISNLTGGIKPGNWDQSCLSDTRPRIAGRRRCSRRLGTRCCAVIRPYREACAEHPLKVSETEQAERPRRESRLYRLARKLLRSTLTSHNSTVATYGKTEKTSRCRQCRHANETDSFSHASDDQHEPTICSELKTFRQSEVLLSLPRPHRFRVNSDFYRIYALEGLMARRGKINCRSVSVVLPSRPDHSKPNIYLGIQAHVGRRAPARRWRELTAMDFSDGDENEKGNIIYS